jgi:hypothetical protein
MYVFIVGARFVEKILKIGHIQQAYTYARNVAWKAL